MRRSIRRAPAAVKEAVLDKLTEHQGANNAIEMWDLASHLGQAERMTRLAVADLRAEGKLICANGNGLFLAASWAEARAYRRRMLSRARHELAAYAPFARQAYAQFSGQMSADELMEMGRLNGAIKVLEAEGDDGAT